MRRSAMQAIIKTIRNIAWLCRPYWKYGKAYLILSIAIPALLTPLNDVIYVYFPKEVVDLLYSGKSFSYITIFVAIICGVSFLTNMIPRFFSCYFKRTQANIDLKVKRDIYEKAIQTDYKFIDNPKYYDNYTWAMDEYASQTSAARTFINNFSVFSNFAQ